MRNYVLLSANTIFRKNAEQVVVTLQCHHKVDCECAVCFDLTDLHVYKNASDLPGPSFKVNRTQAGHRGSNTTMLAVNKKDSPYCDADNRLYS